ncbi:type I restriction enzyme S subunit [Variovorax boronicumulans]|nr:type I restriction enzyme S subunit [Variovorax boronicumulans]MDQ0005322.1 type I restriction enzyme S subunit [Variovorax boronicumulans]
MTNSMAGTLIVGRVGSYCGSVHYSPVRCWVTDNAIVGTSKSPSDSRFWYYKLRSLNLNNHRSGSGQPLLNQQILNTIPVSVPATSDARAQIARVLGALDDKVEVNFRINKTLEAITQAIFKSWFVDFDPVKAKIAAKAEGRDPLRAAMGAISGKSDAELNNLPPEQQAQLAAVSELFPDEMEESEAGKIPKAWHAVTFGSMLTHTIGGDWGTETPDASNDTRVAIIRGTDLPELDQAQLNRVPIRYTSQKKLATRCMKVGDLILEVSGGSRDQPTGRSFRMTANAMREFDCPVEPASFCRLLRPDSLEIGVILGLHLSYIYQQGKTWEYQNQSTGIANFQTAHFLNAELVTRPSAAVAEAFFKIVNPLLERRHDPQGKQLSGLRDTLLPQLLSGELQVQNIGAEAAV